MTQSSHSQPAKKPRQRASQQNGQLGGRPTAPEHATAADAFVRDCLLHPEGHTTLRHWHGSWFLYKTHGWIEISEKDVYAQIMTYLRKHPLYRPNAKTHYLTSVALNLIALDSCGIDPTIQKPSWLDTQEPANDWMAFGNGIIVNMREKALGKSSIEKPVSPVFFSSDFVQYDWNVSARCPMFHTFLQRILPSEESQCMVQQMIGLLLIDSGRYEVMFQLTGNGANGKSTLLDIIAALIGTQNISYVNLEQLNQRFHIWPLAETKANICGELPTDQGKAHLAAIEGALKNVISGGMVECERKGLDKYTAPARARMIMSSNSLPTFADLSDGIWRRLIIIKFPIQIPLKERDPDLARKIIERELPGVLQWALKGLQALLQRGFFAESKESQDLKEQHRQDCDLERTFLLDHYRQGGPDDKVNANAMYETYLHWIKSMGHPAKPRTYLYGRVTDIFPFTQKKKLRNGAEQFQGFQHLTPLNR
jgi:P4 family phage/plasmid primase-like protien